MFGPGLLADLLGKSLQVLTCSSALLQKLSQLQRTEALQRTGGVLQVEEEEEVRLVRMKDLFPLFSLFCFD